MSRFHVIHGEGLALSEDMTNVTCSGKVKADDALFSDRALFPGELFTFRITGVDQVRLIQKNIARTGKFY